MRPLARLRGRRVVPQRSAGELDAMAAAGAVVAAALRAIRAAAAPGTSSLSLDEIAESVIRESGATPSFSNCPMKSWSAARSPKSQL